MLLNLLPRVSFILTSSGEQTSRTLSGTAYTLAYDYDGQLTGITQGANTTGFAYDALGRRHSRTAGGTTTRFIHGPGGILLEKQGSTYTKTFTHGNSQVRMNSEYPMYDGIGSERTVTAANQSVSGTITFEGFGQTVASTGSSANPYMFKGAWGYRNDGDAGLHHVGARYYDAQVGRFITRDTYLDEHPYLYCDHDPVNQADPSGHDAGWAGRGRNNPYGSPELNLIGGGEGFIEKIGNFLFPFLDAGGAELITALWPAAGPAMPILDVVGAINDIIKYGYGNRDKFIKHRNAQPDSWGGGRPDIKRGGGWPGKDWWPNDPDGQSGPGGKLGR